MLAGDKLAVILTALLLGASVDSTEGSEDLKIERYDLEKGPVFYEAYYPENNETPLGTYEKDESSNSGVILERSYQVPAVLREDPYGGSLMRNGIEVQYQNSFQEPAISQIGAFDVAWEKDYDGDNLLGEAPIFTKKAIPEKWRPLLVQSQRSRYSNPNDDLRSQISSWKRPIVEEQNPYEKPFLRLLDYSRIPSSMKRLNPIGRTFDPRETEAPRFLVYRRLPENIVFGGPANFSPMPESPLEEINQIERSNPGSVYPALHHERRFARPEEKLKENTPMENIFEPRPQVINYIFSKDAVKPVEKEMKGQQGKKEMVKEEATVTTTARSYGDNLIQDDIKRSSEKGAGEAKITSIEVSQVKHKIRHHHGERHRRDYSQRHPA
ncbi:uncharacterized protein [Prorops nasuta]|uniref:uncharacterized protein n=1 Tax=Prorops nasuta TaxID=863751 RepID=UPI0034D00C18